MKRYFIAGAVALTLGAGTFAFANSLTVTSTTLASGTQTVDSGCESVAVDYTTTYTTNGYKLATITLDGGTGCGTQAFTVDVADSAGASLGQFTGSLVAGDATITVGTVIDAAAVANVSAVINS
jgi:hypothetical protein